MRKTPYKTVLIVIAAVLYCALLPWPLYVVLPYKFLSGWLKIAAILFAFACELALGIFLTLRQFKKMKETKKTGSKVIFGLLSASYLIYAVTAVIYLAQVLFSVI